MFLIGDDWLSLSRVCPTMCTPSVQNFSSTVNHGLFRGSFGRVREPSRTGVNFIKMRQMRQMRQEKNRSGY